MSNVNTQTNSLIYTLSLKSYISIHVHFPIHTKLFEQFKHYGEVTMSMRASQISGVQIVYLTIYSGADQRKHQTPRHWPLWGEITSNAEMFPFDDVIIKQSGHSSIEHDLPRLTKDLSRLSWWRHQMETFSA